jgi:hypothetical protein
MRSKPAVADLMSAMVSSAGESIVTSEEGDQGVTSGVEGVVEVWKGLQVGRVDINIDDCVSRIASLGTPVSSGHPITRPG